MLTKADAQSENHTWEVQLYAGYLSGRAYSDAQRLDFLTRMEVSAHKLRCQIVADMREAGQSWSAIGAAMGMSKQAAQQRYGA